MNPLNVAFRSKIERDRDLDLARKYREIGIAAIAAAAQHLSVARPIRGFAAANSNYTD